MAQGPLRSLLAHGILGGVGGVLVFLPNILLLFLAIALLEDSGYMARAAFLMDGLMHRIGLHGRSFIPMLTGFGCTVPGVLATRTLESERDRLATIFVLPLMSCGARLPIYTLMTAVFIPAEWRGFTLFSIYFTGILLAILIVKILRITLLAGESTPFVMELPPYRCPTSKAILHHMWNRSSIYIRKAGTMILGVSIILWALSSYPSRPAREIDPAAGTESLQDVSHVQALENLKYSAAGQIGQGLAHVLKPLGFDWRISTALIGAFAAKEIFVAQLGIVFSLGEVTEDGEGLSEALRKSYSPLTGVCVMLFCLIATPCLATVAAVRRETNSWKWPIFQFTALTGLAYVLTLIVYQAGQALGFA
jgi:ferrous iron transport protein B